MIDTRRHIELVPEGEYRRETYSIPLVSATVHDFVGRGIHNPHHRHQLSVWDNARRSGLPNGTPFVDPQGDPTGDRYSYLWTPHANVISAHPALRDNDPVGPALQLGEVVVLTIHGYELGEFEIRANSLRNPHMVRVES